MRREYALEVAFAQATTIKHLLSGSTMRDPVMQALSRAHVQV